MLSIELIRNEPERVKASQKKRGRAMEIVDEVLAIDEKWREKLKRRDELRHRRNEVTNEIAELKQEGEEAEDKIAEMKEVKEELGELENEVEELKQERDELLHKIPNILEEDVPEGEGEEDNVEIKRWGEEPEFDFEPKVHTEILEPKGLLDVDRGSKVAGSDFYFLKEDLVRLDRAIQQFAIDFLREKGYTLVEPPYMVKDEVYRGILGSSQNLGEASYRIEDKDLWMIPTSEYPVGGMFSDETILEKNLPLKICAVSPCFRKEGGGRGKYSRGLYRMHQFNKVEQFVFCKPDESWDYFKELQRNAEELYRKLGLHYRVVNACTGDVSDKQAKLYDVECWMADGNFHETGSNSNCLDYQARNLNIKYREEPGKPPKDYVHTLNSTALATSRTMIAIVEQNQQEDGTVKIPEALRSYMNGQEHIGKE
ncbi:MAG: serine--tRNA ligase [Candidatus Aenigmatarchaeota archaeon]